MGLQSFMFPKMSYCWLMYATFTFFSVGRWWWCHPEPDWSFVSFWVLARGIKSSSRWAAAHWHTSNFRYEMVWTQVWPACLLFTLFTYLLYDSFACSQVPCAGVREGNVGNSSCHRGAAVVHNVWQSGEKWNTRRITATDFLYFETLSLSLSQHVQLLTEHIDTEYIY